ncbi:MAG: hypothetical protein WA902_20195 [Thermosynechococcaceae cyanobacterium]
MPLIPTEVSSTSPTGRYCVVVAPWEARSSLWVATPSIINAETKTTLLSFSDDCWSLDASTWFSENTVKLSLRKYPGNHLPSELKVVVNCTDGFALLPSGRSVILERLEQEINQVMVWI